MFQISVDVSTANIVDLLNEYQVSMSRFLGFTEVSYALKFPVAVHIRHRKFLGYLCALVVIFILLFLMFLNLDFYRIPFNFTCSTYCHCPTPSTGPFKVFQCFGDIQVSRKLFSFLKRFRLWFDNKSFTEISNRISFLAD